MRSKNLIFKIVLVGTLLLTNVYLQAGDKSQGADLPGREVEDISNAPKAPPPPPGPKAPSVSKPVTKEAVAKKTIAPQGTSIRSQIEEGFKLKAASERVLTPETSEKKPISMRGMLAGSEVLSKVPQAPVKSLEAQTPEEKAAAEAKAAKKAAKAAAWDDEPEAPKVKPEPVKMEERKPEPVKINAPKPLTDDEKNQAAATKKLTPQEAKAAEIKKVAEDIKLGKTSVNEFVKLKEAELTQGAEKKLAESDDALKKQVQQLSRRLDIATDDEEIKKLEKDIETIKTNREELQDPTIRSEKIKADVKTQVALLKSDIYKEQKKIGGVPTLETKKPILKTPSKTVSPTEFLASIKARGQTAVSAEGEGKVVETPSPLPPAEGRIEARERARLIEAEDAKEITTEDKEAAPKPERPVPSIEEGKARTEARLRAEAEAEATIKAKEEEPSTKEPEGIKKEEPDTTVEKEEVTPKRQSLIGTSRETTQPELTKKETITLDQAVAEMQQKEDVKKQEKLVTDAANRAFSPKSAEYLKKLSNSIQLAEKELKKAKTPKAKEQIIQKLADLKNQTNIQQAADRNFLIVKHGINTNQVTTAKDKIKYLNEQLKTNLTSDEKKEIKKQLSAAKKVLNTAQKLADASKKEVQKATKELEKNIASQIKTTEANEKSIKKAIDQIASKGKQLKKQKVGSKKAASLQKEIDVLNEQIRQTYKDNIEIEKDINQKMSDQDKITAVLPE